MYTMIERRKINPERMQEIGQRAQSEFFPKLQRAPGFVSFSLVPDEENGITTAIVVWEDKAQADAFQAVGQPWLETLESLGHTRLSSNSGETMMLLQPQKIV